MLHSLWKLRGVHLEYLYIFVVFPVVHVQLFSCTESSSHICSANGSCFVDVRKQFSRKFHALWLSISITKVVLLWKRQLKFSLSTMHSESESEWPTCPPALDMPVNLPSRSYDGNQACTREPKMRA